MLSGNGKIVRKLKFTNTSQIDKKLINDMLQESIMLVIEVNEKKKMKKIFSNLE